MKKTMIYVLIGMLAITTSCMQEVDQKKIPKEEKEVSASVRRTDEGPEALKHPVPGYPVQ